MDFGTEQKDCDALAGLFQQTVNNLKGSCPVWEDFLNKATKLHIAISAFTFELVGMHPSFISLDSLTVAVSTAAFLDAFQKVADLANSSRGVTREMGAALTRLCIRQRSVEGKMKEFASSLVEALVEPLQVKMDDWKKVAVQLDKDHNREYKKAQQELKKALSDHARLSKRASRGGSDLQVKCDQTTRDVREKFIQLETSEKISVRQVMTEEQSRFSVFVSLLKPVMDAEMGILAEMSHLQDVINSLSDQANNSGAVPESIEQVMLDLKGKESTLSYKTPPSSPQLIRKSSLCSVSSSSSGSVIELPTLSPCHQTLSSRSTSLKDDSIQFRQPSSISSQDSGFVSQEVVSDVFRERNSNNVDSCYWKGSLERLKQGITSCDDSSAYSRPHTISSAYERSTIGRPGLTAQTFVDPSAIYATPSTAQRQQHVADIQSRMSVIYARRTSLNIGPQLVMLPSVPADYATSSGNAGTQPLSTAGRERTVSDDKVSSVVGPCKTKQMAPSFHRSCSLPPPINGLVAEPNNMSTDSYNTLRQKFVLMADDNNYITSTPCDFTLQSSQDMESVMNGRHRELSEDRRKYMTLPRNCMPFRIPEVPARFSSVTASGKAKPPPPARRYSAKSTTALNKNDSKVIENGCVTKDDVKDDLFQHFNINKVVADQPRQQDPPSITDDDVLWLPSVVQSQLSETVDSNVLEWSMPSESLAESSTSRVLEPSCELMAPDGAPSLSSYVCVAVEEQVTVNKEMNCSVDDNRSSDESTEVKCTLELIRQGVKLRKTETFDRSAPRVH